MRCIKIILLLLLASFPFMGKAQEKYTDKLKRQNSAGAVVVVHQDAEIEELVNGLKPSDAGSRDTVATTLAEEAKKVEKTSGPHIKTDGYRIQIYMGGNTAQDKAKVKSWARRFKNYFPNVNAYVYFNAPHWVCSVGDYKTREEAQELLTEIRATSQFKSASVVRSKINYFY